MGASDIIRIKPKKSLGQNFLIDNNIARKIARDLHLSKDDVVLEIGAGRGALTKELIGHVRHILIVEIDYRLIEQLQQQFSSPSVTILHQDFLEIELADVQKRYKTKLRIVGNIPYHLTSPIIFKVFEEHSSVYDLTIMVQREVAQRIAAQPGTKEYGILSVFAWFYGVPRILFHVSPNCFFPKPKVTSTVMRILLHSTLPRTTDEALFRTIVRTVFGKRRKTLRNSLKYLSINGKIIEQAAASNSSLLDKRPEQLTVEQFIYLTREIGKILP
ncbi:MAG: ribosomal RNA small subunit methyltransferase A [Ignavibacteriae bacterium]|nr:ribosomal RNA small subunit methyltransferase A [Ignavibacteriota bacterium]